MAKRTLESYFLEPFQPHGRFGMPYIRPQDIDLTDLELIRFSSVVKNENRDQDATVHFFEPDNKFDEVWNNPEPYLGELRQYRQVMSPDFSLYTDHPASLQFLNTFRSRWCGWYWQEHGLTVIPTVSWSDAHSFEYCFDGLPKNAVLAVSTVGCRDSKPGFMAGFTHMVRRLNPDVVINYGTAFPEMLEQVELVEVPYARTSRIARREP